MPPGLAAGVSYGHTTVPPVCMAGHAVQVALVMFMCECV